MVPVSNWQPAFAKFSWMVRIEPDAGNGLSKTSAGDTFQVRSLSETRFVHQLGEVTPEIMEQIERTLAQVLELTP